MTTSVCRRFAVLAVTAVMLSAVGAVSAQDSEPAKDAGQISLPPKPKAIQVALQISVDALNGEARAKNHMMYMPSGMKLVDQKPAAVTKEPDYKTAPKYGVLQIGNGPRCLTYLSFDEPKGEHGKLYVDKNQNGDLTDDGPGDWEQATEKDGMFNYNSNLLLHASWGSPLEETESANYSIWLYKRHGDARAGFVKNSARAGELKIDGQSYPCLLVENNSDAIFTVPAMLERTRRPVNLMIDLNGDGLFTGSTEKVDDKTIVTREIYNLSEPFNLAGHWWIARPSASGNDLIVVPSSPPGSGSAAQQPMERPDLLAAGVAAPDFTAATPDGKTIKLSDFKGKVVILDFWATWCGPCQKSMPGLQKLYNGVREQEVVVLSLNVWDEKDAFDAWIELYDGKTYNFTFAYDAAGRDKPGSVAAKYGLPGIPTMYVINREGKVASAIVGAGQEEALVKSLDEQGIRPKSE